MQNLSFPKIVKNLAQAKHVSPGRDMQNESQFFFFDNLA